MASVAAVRPGNRSGVLAAVLGFLATTASRSISPHRAALRNLASVPLTTVGFGCIDTAGFQLGTGWGWLATGLSLVLLEHIIADES